MTNGNQQFNQNSTRNFLQTVHPFSLLPLKALEQLVPKITRKVFPADSFVFRQGEDSKQVLFIIITGLVEIRVRNDQGKESVAGYRREGDFFGETVALSDKTYPASVKALTDLDCLLVAREDFEVLLENNALFASFFGQVVVDRFRSLFREVAMEPGPLVAYESQAALKRASELMSRPAITCSPLEKTNQLAKIMSFNHISAVVLTGDDGKVAGLVTEKDLVEKVVANSRIPDNLTAGEIANHNPVCISTDSYYYQVLLAMIKGQAKHAIITENDRPVGIITIRDLIRSRNTGVISVVDRLESQSNLESLAQVGLEIDQILTGLVAENAPTPEILDIITEFYDRLTRQIIDIAVEKILPEYGPPPVKFCWLSMGSSGRREQFLRTDQDNALIYQNPDQPGLAEKAESYFAKLADLVVEGLTVCGFAPCQGKVMASNPFWRGDNDYWHALVSKLIQCTENEHVRLLTIFLDFRPVYGYIPLAEDLRQLINKSFAGQPLTFSFLAEDASQGRPPLSFLGNPVGERFGEHRAEINLKNSVSVHLIDCVRLLALKEGATVTNTLERLQYLRQKKTLPGALLDLLETSFETIMLFRLRSNLKKIKAGKKPDNYLQLKSLHTREKLLLKDALKAIDKLMTIIREAPFIY